jgi:anti-sigma-K factor RskA
VTDHAELRDLAAIAVLGALDRDDAERLRAHLDGPCAECAAVAGAWSAAEAVAIAEAPVSPSPALRSRVLASIAVEPRMRGVARAPLRRAGAGRRPAWLRAALAASLAAAVAGGVVAARLAGDLDRERLRSSGLSDDLDRERLRGAALARDLERTRAAYEAASAERVVLAQAVETMGASPSLAFELAGTPEAPAATARGFVAPGQRRGVLIARDLPAPPTGRDYQLWVLRDGVPESAGVLAADALRGAPHGFDVDASRGGALVLAVTLEPAGGLAAPSGPIVMASR